MEFFQDKMHIYEVLTLVYSLFSLVFLTILITNKITIYQLTKQIKIKVADCICFILFTLGIYLIIPYILFIRVCDMTGNIDLYKIAEKISINPYEKKLISRSIGWYYVSPCRIVDGNEAIKYFEKATKNNDSQFLAEASELAYLYAIKGDIQKAEEIAKKYPTLSSRRHYPYIMNDEYEKAINVMFDNDKNAEFNYLKAEVYKKVGNIKMSEESLAKADQLYKKHVKDIADRYDMNLKRYNYKVNNFKSIPAFKTYIKNERQRFNFAD